MFAGLFIALSYQTTATIVNLKTGYDGLTGSVVTLLNDTVEGLNSSPTAINSAVKDIVLEIKNGPLAAKVNSSFFTVVNKLETKLKAIDGNKLTLLNTLNQTDKYVKNVTASATAIPSKVSAIATTINALKTVTINGQTYVMSGFPDVASLSGATSPDLSSIPNIGSFINTIKAIPDLGSVAGTLKTALSDLPVIVNKMLNDSVTQFLPAEGSSMLMFGDIVKPYQAQVNTLLQGLPVNSGYQTVLGFDTYRNYGFIGEMLLIILPGVLGILGIVFRKRVMMTPFCTCVLLLSLIIWIQSVLFFFVSAPFNLVCNSRSAFMETSYNVPDMSVITGLTVRPQTLFDDCLADKKIFNARLNSNGDDLLDIVGNVVHNMVDQFLSPSTVKQQFQFPDIDQNLNQIDTSSVNSFNTSALDGIDVSMKFNITSKINDIQASINNLTVASIDPTLGNPTTLQQKISLFNTAASNTWTYRYIVDTYIAPNVNYAGAGQTEYNNAKPYIAFTYSANNTLTSIKANMTIQLNSLQAIQNVDIANINAQAANIKAATQTLKSAINSTLSIVNDVKANTGAEFKIVTNSFIDWMVTYASSVINGGVTDLLTALLIDNPIEAFGKCKNMISSLDYLFDGICIGTVDTFAGLWFSTFSLGILMAIGFIVTVITKKRIAFIQLRKNSVKNKDYSDHKDNDLERGNSSGGYSANQPYVIRSRYNDY